MSQINDKPRLVAYEWKVTGTTMASVPEGIQTAIPGHSSVPSGLISCDTWRWLTIDIFDNYYLQGRSQHKLNSILCFIESHLLLSYVHPRVRKQFHPVLWLEKESLKKDDKNNNKHFTNTCGWPLTYKKRLTMIQSREGTDYTPL